ncbi:hypothetical protein ACI2KR_29995 [Pseudomonas luteola]
MKKPCSTEFFIEGFYNTSNNIKYQHKILDAEGNIIVRCKQDYPYNFSDYVSWVKPGYNKNDPLQEGKKLSCDYTDRLYGSNAQLFDSLLKKHFAGEFQPWVYGRPEKIEAFLRDYYDDTSINLVKKVDCCNQATGYPIWAFVYINNNA